MNTNLPEGYQPVYILYTGMGTQEFLTASSDEKAVELIQKEYRITHYFSAFKTGVIIKSAHDFFLRGGIPILIGREGETNLLKDIKRI